MSEPFANSISLWRECMNRHLIAWGICTETSLINQAPSICKHVCLSCSFQGTTTQTDNISKSKGRWNIPAQILLQKPAIEKLLFLWTLLICLMRCLLSRCKTAMFSKKENHLFFQFLLSEKITKVRKPRKIIHMLFYFWTLRIVQFTS